MAINPSSTHTFDIATIIRRAYQLAGLMNAIESTADPMWSAKAEMAADFLDMKLKALQSSSILEKHVSLDTVTIVGGTSNYTIAPEVLGILGNGMFAETGSDTQIPVVPIGREAWQAITNKASDGLSARYWFDRYSHQLNLWPVPQDNGTLTIQAHRLIADGDNSAYDVELELHWTEWLVYSLAHMLAMSNGLPLDRVSYFKALADETKTAVDGYSKASDPSFMYCVHSTGWNR